MLSAASAQNHPFIGGFVLWDVVVNHLYVFLIHEKTMSGHLDGPLMRVTHVRTKIARESRLVNLQPTPCVCLVEISTTFSFSFSLSLVLDILRAIERMMMWKVDPSTPLVPPNSAKIMCWWTNECTKARFPRGLASCSSRVEVECKRLAD